MELQIQNMRIVHSVLNSKIPDLLEVMEKARAKYLERMDVLALKMEEDILGLAENLKTVCLSIARDQNFDEEQDAFDDLWFGLNDAFKKYLDYCGRLDIHLSDICCLTLSDYEVSSSSDEDDETSANGEGEEEAKE